MFTHDIGAVILDEDIGDVSGTLDFAVRSSSDLMSRDVGITGYSVDKPLYTQWQSFGPLEAVDSRRLYFRLDVTFGNSGGPVWITQGGSHQVVGIVSSGSALRNAAVRVTDDVLAHLEAWSEGASGGAPAGAPEPGPERESVPARTITVSPDAIEGARGDSATAVVAIGGANGQGNLTVSSSGGTLVANGAATPTSCAGGTMPCSSVTGSGSPTVTIPDNGNDLSTVLLTIGGTIERTVTVEITAGQGGAAWSGSLQVTMTDAGGGGHADGRFTGEVAPVGLSLVTYAGGSLAQLEDDAVAHGVTVVAITDAGVWHLYVIDAPAFVNASFVERFPGGLEEGQPVVLRVE